MPVQRKSSHAMPGVETRPMGSGSVAPANSQASPPSASFTNFGAFSRYCLGSHSSQMSVGSRTWASAETISYPLIGNLRSLRSLTLASGYRAGQARRQAEQSRTSPGEVRILYGDGQRAEAR